MGSVNVAILVGNLGRDAEVRFIASGACVAKFSLACSEVWTDKSGQRQERTEWVDVELWGRLAEAVGEFLTKGRQVYVQGKLQTDEYEGRDGVKKRRTKVRAERLVLLGGPRGEGGDRAPARTPRMSDYEARYGTTCPAAAGGEPVWSLDEGMPSDDDIPF